MAGACVALHLSTLAPATNPAAMVFLGGRYDISIDYFRPDRDYDVVGNPSGQPGTFGLAPGDVSSDSLNFVIPGLGGNWKISDRFTVGVALYGNGGMNTDYNARTFGFKPTGVDLAQMFIAPTVAFKIADGQAIGASAIAAYQRFKAQGLRAFGMFSSSPANLTNNGYDSSWGYGGRFGYLGEFGIVSIGGSYQTKVSMGKFDAYSGLFAEQGSFDIPPTWTVGIAIRPIPAVTVTGDYEQILYSQVPSIANPLLPNLVISQLGDDNGAGFGWQDISTWKVGIAVDVSNVWTLRGGYSQGDQPIPSSQILFNVLAPGVIVKHGAIGATYHSNHTEFNLAVVRAFSHTVSGPNPLEVPGQQTIKLRMNQWEVDLGVGFGF
jgi:long-chain fatty acid transport protein